jgi:hypothetical protein
MLCNEFKFEMDINSDELLGVVLEHPNKIRRKRKEKGGREGGACSIKNLSQRLHS